MNWLTRLRALLLGPAPAPAPPPDTSVAFKHVREIAVEILYSNDKRWRAIVTRDPAGLFRVHRETWDTGDWEIVRQAFWAPADQTATITDTADNARKLAAEAIAAVTDQRSRGD